MSELRLPCRESETPDDWFIGRDGKQYSDEDLLTDEVRLSVLVEANERGLEGSERVEFIERAEDRAEADAKTAALQRRRHAMEACHTDCLFRTRCLDMALDGDLRHGTWGGYYEEQIAEIRDERDRRRLARAQARLAAK